jgi:hypothetical protein
MTHRRDVLRMIAGAAIGTIVPGAARVANALEMGKPAPDLTLPGTNGERVSLKQFRGNRFVLLEFFGAAFAPT